jgi:hypothetical protein
LRLSEDAACNRITAARVCRQFPVVADMMSSGEVSLTALRLLGPHLTSENHRAILARASYRRRSEIQELVAELAPQPDLAASVRRLPGPRVTAEPPSVASEVRSAPQDLWTTLPHVSPSSQVVSEPTTTSDPVEAVSERSLSAGNVGRSRPVVQASAPGRYRVQFTIGRQAYEELRRVQALLRREIPDGDPGRVFERALHLLLDQVETTKLGARTTKPRRIIRSGTDHRINPRTDDPLGRGKAQRAEAGAESAARNEPRMRHAGSRSIRAAVRAAVWKRDQGRCAFVARSGHRCTERTFLEFHHLVPFALGGRATVDNIALRCRRHNQYEGELDFGPRPLRLEGTGLHPD